MSRRAIALLDLLLAVALIGVLAMVAVPALNPSESLQVLSGATALAADLEYAQSASLASPGDPVVVVVDSEQARYWLALTSDPKTPIARSNGTPYDVRFGEGLATHLQGLGIALTQPKGASDFAFDAFGRLGSGQDAVLTVSGKLRSMSVRVRGSTGTVVIGE